MRIHQFHDIPAFVLLESTQRDQQLPMLILGMGEYFSHYKFFLGLCGQILPIERRYCRSHQFGVHVISHIF